MTRPALRLCALLCACSLLFAGCGSKTPAPESVPSDPVVSAPPAQPQQPQLLTVGFNASEGFNPYLSPSSLVSQGAGLVLEKLVEIAPDMSLSYRLASSIDCVGEQVLIHIRGGCTFADGTPITEQDAAASLNAARTSELYAARFANILNVEAQQGAVVLTLAQPDSLFAYLCDIPVIRADEVGLPYPTASGRYTYDGSDSLVKNPRSSFSDDGPARIQLTPVTSYEEMVSGLTVGSLNLYSVREAEDAAPSVTSKQTYYHTNNLVFLGVNASGNDKEPLLATAAGRSLLSQITDRRQLAEKSYYSRAWPATGAVNSFYPCVAGKQLILPEAQLTPAQAREILQSMGYQIDPISGYFEDGSGKRLSLRLTVYSGSTYKKYAANLIQHQMAACGIEIVLDQVDNFDLWCEKIEQGDFQLYIGEVKLYNNMDMSPFFKQGAAGVGIVQSEALALAYTAFRQNQSAAGAFEAAFAAEMPLIPLLWRNGTIIHSREISGLSPSISNVFYSLAGLQINAAQNS